jgi:hypothetical protein
MAVACSIELCLDRTHVPSNGRLMKELGMVMMATKRLVVTMNHQRATGGEGPIRTPAVFRLPGSAAADGWQ